MNKSRNVSMILMALLIMPFVLCAEDVQPFERLLLVGNKNTDIILHSSAEYKLEVSGIESNKILAGVVDSTLTVLTAGQETDVPIRVDIYAPSFRYVNCSFMKSLASIDTITSGELTVIVSYTDMNILLQVDCLNLSYEGAKAELKGVCHEANVRFRGYADGKKAILEATGLEARDLHIDCGIYSLINLHVINSLWLTGGASTIVNVLGSPVIRENNLSDYHLTMRD